MLNFHAEMYFEKRYEAKRALKYIFKNILRFAVMLIFVALILVYMMNVYYYKKDDLMDLPASCAPVRYKNS